MDIWMERVKRSFEILYYACGLAEAISKLF